MRNKLSKYSVVCFFFIGCFGMLADTPGQPGSGTTPPPHECCEGILPEGYDGSENPDPVLFPELAAKVAEYKACELDPEAYCTIPIDNSIYIYISIVAGVALASFVIARRMKT